jgi:hypothetical protein
MKKFKTNITICEGLRCSREATNLIYFIDIPLYLCDVCVKIFQDKKTERELERQVARPACSNINQYQKYQQYEEPLND